MVPISLYLWMLPAHFIAYLIHKVFSLMGYNNLDLKVIDTLHEQKLFYPNIFYYSYLI